MKEETISWEVNEVNIYLVQMYSPYNDSANGQFVIVVRYIIDDKVKEKFVHIVNAEGTSKADHTLC